MVCHGGCFGSKNKIGFIFQVALISRRITSANGYYTTTPISIAPNKVSSDKPQIQKNE